MVRNRKDPVEYPKPLTAYEVAEYSGALIRSLRRMASAQRLGLLAHLLELAEHEALRLTVELGDEHTADARDRLLAGGSADAAPASRKRRP
jgi:hypothetical protein